MKMKRKVSVLLIVLLLIPSISFGQGLRVTSKAANFIVNNKPMKLKTLNIKGNNYMTIRDFATIMKGTADEFDVSWNQTTKDVEIVTKTPYKDSYPSPSFNKAPAKAKKASLVIDGKKVTMPSYLVKGNTCFKIRDLSKLIDVNIFWRHPDNIVVINSNSETGPKALESTDFVLTNLKYPYPTRYGINYNSFLVEDPAGFSLLSPIFNSKTYEFDNNYIRLDSYNSSNKLLKSKKIKKELPIFNSFFQGDKYNYIVYGDSNPKEDKNKPVIAVVKYDRNFNKLGSFVLKAGEAIVMSPFDAGATDIDERGNILTIHSSRKRFKSDDGLNHQSQLSFSINTDSMTLVEDISDFQDNHVSHSFNQFVKETEDGPVFLDHGDAYPRSIVINRPNPDKNDYRGSYLAQDLFKIPGKTGANATGVSLGGFEMMEEGFLVAMNSVDHSKVKEYTHFELVGLDQENRDVLVLYTDLDTSNKIGVKELTVKKYSNTNMFSSVPEMVKLDNKRAMVLWEEFDKNGRSRGLLYRIISTDSQGLSMGKEVRLNNFQLSYSKPRLIGDKVTWVGNVDYIEKPNLGTKVKFEIKVK